MKQTVATARQLPRWILGTLGLVLLAAWFAGPGSTVASARWLRPAVLSNPGDLAIYPQAALDARGHATASWTELKGKGVDYTVMSSIQTKPGMAWSRPLKLSQDNVFSGFPQLAVGPTGSGVAVWVTGLESQTPNPPPPFVGTAFRSSSGKWSRSARISSPGVEATLAKVATSAGGTAIAVWVQNTAEGSSILAATGDTIKQAWSTPVRLDTRSGPLGAYLPQIAMDARGDAVATWMRFADGRPGFGARFNHVVAAVKPAGGRWQRPAILGTEEEFFSEESASFEFPGPRVAVDAGGDAIIVWQGRSGRTVAPVASIRRAHAHRWQKPVAIARRPGLDPHVSLDSAGDANVVWVGAGNSVMTSRRPIGSRCTWTKPQTLYRGNPFVFPYPQVSANALGQAVATWAGHPFVQASVLSSPTGSWSRAARLGPGGVPQAAIDGRGNAIVVWQRARSGAAGDIVVQAARYVAPHRSSRRARTSPCA